MIRPALAQSCWFTPPAIGRRYGVKSETVLGWIRSGELRAIDVARRGSRRPRFRIDPADLAIFEAGRAATPPPKPARRRRRDPNVIEFF